MTDNERRVAATIRTDARFRSKPFDWRTAGTCIHLVRYHAKAMGHHVPIVPRFRSARGALRALKKTGFDTLPALLDDRFVPIPAARMRIGDVVALPGHDDRLPALAIKADVHKFLGWHEADLSACQYSEIDLSANLGAWQL